LERIATFIQNHPRSILVVFVILFAAALYPALQIETDFNLENFFPKEDPTINDYQYLEQEFGRDDNVIMVGFRNETLLTPPVLSDLKSIVDSVANIPYVTDVRSLWSAEQIESDGERLSFDPFLHADSLETLKSADLRADLLEDTFVNGFLINETADVTAFYIEIADDRNNFETRDRILGNLDRILAPYRDRYDFKISGIPYYRNQYVHYLNREIIIYILLSSLLIVFVLWILYRSFTGIIIPILIVWLTIVFTLAVMHLTGGFFEVMSSTIAPILVCVGIADSVHMISKYDDARVHGRSRKYSIREMLITLGYATFLTSITTAVGFGSLFTSNIVPMMRFGIYTAAGVMIAYVITIFLLPTGLSMVKVKSVFKDKSARIFTMFTNFLEWVSRINQQHYKAVTIGVFALTALIGSGIFLLKINGKVFDELGHNTEPIQHAQFFTDNLTPPFPMEFIIDSGRENGITDPEFVRQLEAFTRELESRSEFERIISFNTLLREIHHAMVPETTARKELPGNSNLVAQYLLLLEFSDSDALERFTDFNYQKVRVSTNVKDIGSYRINQLQDSLSTYLAGVFPSSKITITGSTILSADLNEKIVSSLFKSILLAFVLISILMAFLFRNSRLVFISLIPNILPLVFIAGVMGFTNIDIKASTAIIFTVAFGIAVDDSIHYLARIRVEMKRGKNLFDALHTTTLKTGRAIIVTSVLLVAGFSSLLTSVFQSTANMGLLVSLTVVSALIADLFLLPSLFYWIKPKLRIGTTEKSHDARPVDVSAQQEALRQS